MIDDMQWQKITHIPEVLNFKNRTKDIIKDVYKEDNYSITDIRVAFHAIINEAIYLAKIELEVEERERDST